MREIRELIETYKAEYERGGDYEGRIRASDEFRAANVVVANIDDIMSRIALKVIGEDSLKETDLLKRIAALTERAYYHIRSSTGTYNVVFPDIEDGMYTKYDDMYYKVLLFIARADGAAYLYIYTHEDEYLDIYKKAAYIADERICQEIVREVGMGAFKEGRFTYLHGPPLPPILDADIKPNKVKKSKKTFTRKISDDTDYKQNRL